MNYTTRGLLVVLLFSFTPNIFAAGNDKAVLQDVTAQGSAVISGNLTYDQAKSIALHQARTRAVEQAAGIHLETSTIIENNLMLIDMVKTFSYGFIIRESAPQWNGKWIVETDKPGYPVIEVSLTSTVKVFPKQFFNNYTIEATLDKQTYRSGEHVRIQVTPKKSMYVYIVNYTSKNNIIPLFPNPDTQQNLIPAGTTLNLPINDSEAKIVVKNYAGHTLDVEAFIILGFESTPDTQTIPWDTLLETGKEIEYASFFNTILDLPIRSIAEKTLVYTIVNN